MKTLIYSSSEGSRLRPLTSSMPVCMLPVMGRPIIEHTIRNLHRHNITDITVSCTYLQDEIKKHFSLSPVSNVNIEFSEIKSTDEYTFDEDTLILNSDIITDIDFTKLIKVHQNSISDATIVLARTLEPYEYGAVHINRDSYVTSYNKCPELSEAYSISFTSIMIVKKGVTVSGYNSIEALLEKLIENNFKIYACTPDCYIKSICNLENYHKCRRDFMDNKISLFIDCEQKAPGVWIDKDATVMQGSVISPPVYISKGCVINKGARIEAYTELSENVSIDCYASIKRSMIMSNSCISEGVSIRGSIIGSNCCLGTDSAVYEGSVIGFGTTIGKRSTIRGGAHIWPQKHIEDDVCVSENMIWGNTRVQSLFIDGSCQGIINREITPEFAVSLGRAVATMLGGSIGVSSDGHASSCMIKSALLSGLQSGGCDTFDMGEQPLPITRSAVRFYSLSGGIALSTVKKNSNIYCSLDIINSSGANIENEDIKKLSLLMHSDNVRISSASMIKETEYMFEYKLFYIKNLINSTSKKPLGAKLLIYCPSLWARELLKSAAFDLDCSFSFSENTDETSFCQEVTLGDYDMGVMCDYKCETLTVITKSGYILSEFEYSALTSLIVMKSFPDAVIYISASAPDSIEKLSEKYGVRLKRTRFSPPYLMNELSKNDNTPYLHQFIYNFDAVGAIIILLDYLYTSNITLEDLMSEIPPSGTVSTSVNCNKEEQTEALQRLYLRYHIDPGKISDSVKIDFDNGWVLVVPQASRSSIRIISHSFNKEYARELADICTDDILRR